MEIRQTKSLFQGLPYFFFLFPEGGLDLPVKAEFLGLVSRNLNSLISVAPSSGPHSILNFD